MKNSSTQPRSIISRIMKKVNINKQNNTGNNLSETGSDYQFSSFNGMLDNANSIFIVRGYLGAPIHQV